MDTTAFDENKYKKEDWELIVFGQGAKLTINNMVKGHKSKLAWTNLSLSCFSYAESKSFVIHLISYIKIVYFSKVSLIYY